MARITRSLSRFFKYKIWRDTQIFSFITQDNNQTTKLPNYNTHWFNTNTSRYKNIKTPQHQQWPTWRIPELLRSPQPIARGSLTSATLTAASTHPKELAQVLARSCKDLPVNYFSTSTRIWITFTGVGIRDNRRARHWWHSLTMPGEYRSESLVYFWYFFDI